MSLFEGGVVFPQYRLNGRYRPWLLYYYCIEIQYKTSIYLVQQLIRRNPPYPGNLDSV